jgi:phosphocarrier protein HPr
MPQRRAIIGSAQGLHARPASRFTQAVAGSGHAVEVSRPDGTPVPAASLLLVMSLALRAGDEVVLSCADPAAEPALDELVALLESELDAA